MVIGNNAFGNLRGDLRGDGLFFIHCDTRHMGEKMSDLVKRLRMDVEPSEGDMEDAADRIEKLQELVELAYGLLWHDKHNEARRLLLGALSKEEQSKGITMARDYKDKYKPGEIPLPQPIGKAIEALEEAAKQSQWWSVDEDNDTGWVKYSIAAVVLTHWAAGLADGKDE